jgi:DNA polymerase epsilon subunit 3
MAERPEDLNLPNSIITRIIKDAVGSLCQLWHLALALHFIRQIPEGVNVSKDARLAISKAASIFVLYVTSW